MTRYSKADTERALKLLAEQRADDYVKGYEADWLDRAKWTSGVVLICLAIAVIAVGGWILWVAMLVRAARALGLL